MRLCNLKCRQLLSTAFLLILATLMGWPISCSVRERDNIFDPKNPIDSLDLSLTLTSADSLISFYWHAPGGVSFKGFHLYRKLAGEPDFSSRAILAATQTTFTDTAQGFDIPHAYFLTLIGASTESPPSKQLHVVPGPGQIWLLDRWDEYFYKFSYDLRHKLLTHYAIWIPQDLAVNKAQQQILVTYPLFHYAELLDSQTGALLQDIETIAYPYACVFHAQQNAYWISDSTGYLFRAWANNVQNPELIDDALRKPIGLLVDAQGDIHVLDLRLNQIITYDLNGNRLNTISDFDQPIFLGLNTSGTHLYVINRGPTQNEIFRISTLNQQAVKIFADSNLTLIKQSPIDGSLWIVQNNKTSAKILQLSDNGVRLNTLGGFGNIADLAVNPYNGNIVIADRKLHQVIHMRANGNVIGKVENAPYPYRIFIE